MDDIQFVEIFRKTEIRNMINNFLSEEAVWESISEFVDSNGKSMACQGKSSIKFKGEIILNESYSSFGEKTLTNDYEIRIVSENRYSYTSMNPVIGVQTGFFDINQNTIYSKFSIKESELNGYEIIRRIEDTCYANGALYNGNELINTWSATLHKVV
ncbi:MAG: hypothetical protein WCS17_04325 [Prevotella sp.]